jgi:hypothetical protein
MLPPAISKVDEPQSKVLVPISWYLYEYTRKLGLTMSAKRDEMDTEDRQEKDGHIDAACGYDNPHDVYHKHYRSVERHFVVVGKEKPQVLLAMVRGIDEFKDLETTETFKGIQRIKRTKTKLPQNQDLCNEVGRRAHFMAEEWKKSDGGERHPLASLANSRIKVPETTNWRRPRIEDWLRGKTLALDRGGKDIAFLRGAIRKFKMEIAASDVGGPVACSSSPWEGKGWHGLVPWIRLVHILDTDDMKMAFMKTDASGNNSPPDHFWAELQERFDDKYYRPKSHALDDSWGVWYNEEHGLGWDVLSALGVEPLHDEKAAEEMYRSLNSQLGAIYKTFKKYGAGDSRYGKDLECGHQQGPDRNMGGGDRLNSLHDRNPATMYLWYILLVNDLFRTSLPQPYEPQEVHDEVVEVFDDDASSVESDGSSTQAPAAMIREESRKWRRLMLKSSRLSGLRAEQSTLQSRVNGLRSQLSQIKEQKDNFCGRLLDLEIRMLDAPVGQQHALQDMVDRVKGYISEKDTEMTLVVVDIAKIENEMAVTQVSVKKLESGLLDTSKSSKSRPAKRPR